MQLPCTALFFVSLADEDVKLAEILRRPTAQLEDKLCRGQRCMNSVHVNKTCRVEHIILHYGILVQAETRNATFVNCN